MNGPPKTEDEFQREIEALSERIVELDHEVESLKRNDDRLQLAVRGSSDGVWYWDITTGIEWWSPRFRELLGYSNDELPATYESWESLLHPDDREQTSEAVRGHLESKSAYDIEYRLRTRHAGYRWFLARGLAEWDRDDRPVRMAGSIQDITERKQVGNALRREKEFSDGLINSSLDGILAFDRDCRYTAWNPAMERISGVSQTEVIGRIAFDVFPFLVETGEDRFFKDALAGKTQVTRDRPYVVPETGREGFYEGYYSPLRNESGEIVGGLAIIRDISERKHAENQRERLEERLRQSQKMEAIGQLAGGIAHDFNNLLTAVLGNAHILLARLSGKNLDKHSVEGVLLGLEHIKDAGERAALLTQQLLAFSRKQVIKPELLDLNRVISGMKEMLRPLIREDIEFVVRVAPDTHHIRADAGQIEQVIMNLVVNARDAMPEGGTLTVVCSNEDEAHVTETSIPIAGPRVVLAVSDTGLGMDKEQVSHIFEPFFTTKPTGKGTGLGLATVYGIVTQVNGEISVESEPGKGSTFRLYFAADNETAAVPDEAASTCRSGGNEVIVVCEDDQSVRRVVCDILQQAGYRVLETEHGEHALEAAASFDDEIHLLISDVIMPVMNGKELAEKMVSRHPGIVVLFTSGYATDVLGRVFSQSKEQDYLQKPFSPDALLHRVRELLDSRGA